MSNAYPEPRLLLTICPAPKGIFLSEFLRAADQTRVSYLPKGLPCLLSTFSLVEPNWFF
jgi:hypothetical protein